MLKKIVLPLVLAVAFAASAFAAVNLNTADVKALESIKGIGPAKAEAIVKYREEHGPFKTIEELANVKGIGPQLVNKIKPHVEVSR